MKSNLFRIVVFFAIVLATAACSDRNAEKKIAELEARLKELEGKKPANSTAGAVPGISTATTPVQPVSDEKPAGPLPAMQFATTDYDFGTINEGDVVEHTFKFTNTGAAPLVIQSAQASCGCTVPDWSKDPIPVGGTGFVQAKFDSNGKPNIQNKTITVTANTWPKQTVLRFKAMVTPKGNGANGPVR